MKVKTPKPQFLLDSNGKRTFVVLSIKEYEELLEDLHDLAVMAKRKDEPSISFEALEKELKADGLL